MQVKFSKKSDDRYMKGERVMTDQLKKEFTAIERINISGKKYAIRSNYSTPKDEQSAGSFISILTNSFKAQAQAPKAVYHWR